MQENVTCEDTTEHLTSLVVEGLVPYTVYRVRVRGQPMTSSYSSPWSTWLLLSGSTPAAGATLPPLPLSTRPTLHLPPGLHRGRHLPRGHGVGHLPLGRPRP